MSYVLYTFVTYLLTARIIIIICYYYYLFKLKMGFYPVEVVLQ
jgi:hypothetical protein